MRVRDARVFALGLPLRRPLATAHGVIDERRVLLVEVRDTQGRLGYGEAAPIAGFPGESLAQARTALEAGCERLRASAGDQEFSVDRLGELIPFAKSPLAHGALASALLDLAAQQSGVPLARHLLDSAGFGAAGELPRELEVNALLGEGDERELAEAGRRAVAEGIGTLKLKIGALPIERDLARLRSLRDAVGRDVRIRADANAAWTRSEALAACARFEDLGLEWLEQPVRADPADDLFAVAAASRVPIAADETAASAEGARAVIEDGQCRALILKPALLGGPLAGLLVAARAIEAGMEVVVTTLIDSAVGRAGALHVAAAAAALSPRPARAQGLATASLLAADVCAPAPAHEPLSRGAMRVPSAPGLGVAPEAAALARLVVEIDS